MHVIRTGLQGNGKTLNTIREVDLKAAKEGRDVYYHNIREFNPEHPVLKANWQEFDNPHEWFKLPQNSIIVIDEAQTFFRTRPQGSKLPEYASALETMRHSGHELHSITQSPKLLDSHMRELCNSHIHYYRGHKGSIIKRIEFEKVQIDVNRKMEFTDGQVSRITLAKEYFGTYKSVADGAEHHFKFKPPRALFIFLACVIGIGYGAYRIYENRLSGPKEAAPVEQAAQASEASSAPAAPAQAASGDLPKPMTAAEYAAAHTPRIPDVPSSAPIYDTLRAQPVSYPKAICVATKDVELMKRNSKRMTIAKRKGVLYGCGCSTQQGSRLDVSFAGCMNYVENGWFDSAKPDPINPAMAGEAGGIGPGEGRAGTMTPADRRLPRLTVVSDTSRDGRPLNPVGATGNP